MATSRTNEHGTGTRPPTSPRRHLRALPLVALLAALAPVVPWSPSSASHVEPELVPGNPSCAELHDDPTVRELKVEPVEDGTYTDGTLEVTIAVRTTADGEVFDWGSNVGVDSVVAKGGPQANHYEYDPPETADTGLHAPLHRSGKFAGLSHISFCYIPAPSSTLEKGVRNVTAGEETFVVETTAAPGDEIQYQLVYENSGLAIATNVAVTEEVPDHSSFLECSDNCTEPDPNEPGSEISWSLGDVPAGETRTVTFNTALDDSFPAGETVIPNIATVTTDEEGTKESNEARVVVTAAPDLRLEKEADGTTFSLDDEITYELSYGNDGDAAASDTTITEEIPDHTHFVTCSDDCELVQGDGEPGTVVEWAIGTLAAGAEGSVTLTVRVTAEECEICNQAHIASPDHDGGEPVASNEVCVEVTALPNPDGANASGEATGIHVAVAALDLEETITTAGSSQSGIGTADETDELLEIGVPGVVGATLVGASTHSAVEEDPARARQVSTAVVADVCILPDPLTELCTVEADVVRAVAEATATGTSAAFNAEASTIEGLRILGVEEDVTPDTLVPLPAGVFGDGSYVAVFERDGSTQTPPAGQLSGGTYEAQLAVSMIRVHVTDFATLGAVEVVVAHASAHADFPQLVRCEASSAQVVGASAFVLGATTDPDLASIEFGRTSIPATGGSDHQNLLEASVPGLAATGTSVSDSHGELDEDASAASSFAEVQGVCLLPGDDGCLISADLVRAQSNSGADETGAQSNAIGTTLVGLNIAGAPAMPLEFTPEPNTVIVVPGIGTIILNQQFCDNGGTLEDSCSDGAQVGHAGLTVRAIHVILDGLPVGATVIVAEAHSHAGFVVANG